jgi:dipeptidyl aminopeptidase/acylaminoacyl peptidase
LKGLFALSWLSAAGRACAAWLLLAAAGESHAQAVLLPQPEKAPVASFAGRPFITGLELSPDGQRFVARFNVQGKPTIGVMHLYDRSKTPILISTGDYRVRWYSWAGNDRLLISVAVKTSLDGNEVFARRLIVYELSTKRTQSIAPKSRSLVGDDVLHIADDGSHLLLGLARDIFSYPAVQRVDLATTAMIEVQKPKEPIVDWYADSSGNVRAGVGYVGRKMRIYYRDKPDEEFRLLGSVWLEDSEDDIESIHIPSDSDKGLIISNANTGRFALYEFDWKSSEIGAPLFEHPDVDIDEVFMSADGKRVDGVSYTDDRERVQWFNEDLKALQQEIDATLASRMNWVTSMSRDRSRMIVWSGTADDPGQYFNYNRETRRMDRIATPYEALRGLPMAPVRFVKYRARDGLEIPAYLTLPLGREPKNLPLVLLPHGGPHVRDTWSFDYWVQFLANRGYAVFQPNFRGSSGYGKSFLEKGFGQWGRAMQDDLTDGVKWLIGEGTVDPQRVCIMGGSYGGYAALMGAITTPGLYRCAISWAGVTNVADMMRYDRSQLLPARYKNWRQRVKGEDPVDLKEVSPTNRAQEVTIPLLLAHGTDDDNVLFKQAEKMVKALESAGKKPEFMRFEGVGHVLEDEVDRIRFLTAVESFLAQHNPAD